MKISLVSSTEQYYEFQLQDTFSTEAATGGVLQEKMFLKILHLCQILKLQAFRSVALLKGDSNTIFKNIYFEKYLRTATSCSSGRLEMLCKIVLYYIVIYLQSIKNVQIKLQPSKSSSKLTHQFKINNYNLWCTCSVCVFVLLGYLPRCLCCFTAFYIGYICKISRPKILLNV